MKKIISIILIVLMVFSLCACSSDNKNTSDTNSNNNDKTVSTNSGNNDETVSTNSNDNIEPTNNSAEINLNKYVSVNFEGYNLAGYGSVKFDKEKFLLDHIDNIFFNEENHQVYRELYGNEYKSAANAILQYISVNLDKSNKLSNGNTVKLVWKINTDKVNTYFKWDYTYSAQTFTVSGLKEASSFDAFENVKVTFSGIAPFGKASVYNYGTNYGGSYTVTPTENLKNGDKVKVTFSCDDKSTMISKYNKYPSSFEKTYIVSGLNAYVKSVNDISNDQLDKLISNARDKIWVLGWGNYKEAKYCGNYFYYTKSEPINDYGNAIHFVFEHPEQIGVSNSPNVYTVISLSSLKMNEKGELIYNKHDMAQGYNTYKSKEALHKAFVDECDNKMSCSNNVKFN